MILEGLSTETYNTIGIVGSSILSLAAAPQIMKIYNTKDSNGISVLNQVMSIVGISLILVYGLGRDLWPTYTSSSVSLAMSLTSLAMVLSFRSGPSEKTTSLVAADSMIMYTDVPVLASLSSSSSRSIISAGSARRSTIAGVLPAVDGHTAVDGDYRVLSEL